MKTFIEECKRLGFNCEDREDFDALLSAIDALPGLNRDEIDAWLGVNRDEIDEMIAALRPKNNEDLDEMIAALRENNEDLDHDPALGN